MARRQVWLGCGLGIAAVVLAAAAPARASDIRVVGTGASAMLELTGIIQPGDDAKLADALKVEPRPTTIALSSLGGNVQAALGMGTLLHNDGLRTTVRSNAICASACGLVWLGGTPRVLARNAHVGLHAAYLHRDGMDVETGAANALIGAYLGRLGLGDRAIAYLTSAPPDEMTWILPLDRTRYGIAFETDAPSAMVAARADPQDRPFWHPLTLARAIASAAAAAVDRLIDRGAPVGHP